MNEKVENLILEQLRAIRGDIAHIKADIQGLKTEMNAIRLHVRGVETLQDHDHGDIAAIKLRLERIEKRLELADGE